MLAPRRLGDAHIQVIGFGCMNVSHAYGPALPEDQAIKVFRHALDSGYDFFDTATIYGLGNNGKLLGRAIGQRRSEFFLASKCVMGMRDGKRVLDGRPKHHRPLPHAPTRSAGADRGLRGRACRAGHGRQDPLRPEQFHEADLRESMPRFAPDNYPKNLAKLKAMRANAVELACSVPDLALAWVLAQGVHVVALPGTTRIDYLEQNFSARRLALPDATVDQLSSLFAPDTVAGNRYAAAMQQSIDTECFDFEVYVD